VLGKDAKNGVPQEIPTDLPFSESSKRIFELAQIESRKMGMRYIAPEHIFLALLEYDDVHVTKIVKLMNMSTGTLKAELLRRLNLGLEEVVQMTVSSGTGAKESEKKGKSDVLEAYCKDLCVEAEKNKIDPIIGRHKEVNRVAQILARRRKNNVMLIGNPGVGKTAIAEGLACAILSGFLPDGLPLPSFLANKRLLQVDLPLLIAGAKERGELESRVTEIIKACKEDGNIILVIDEIHCMVGGGSNGKGKGVAGSSDIGNLFKPSLARGEVQCIGATTIDEYRKYIETDAALERRFQPLTVHAPSDEETLKILTGVLGLYERHHQCIYAEEAINAAVQMSSRYIADRQMPDKAIDVLDEAGSRVRIKAYKARIDRNEQLSDVDLAAYKELMQVVDAKDEATRDMLYEEATLLRSREINLKTSLAGPPEDGAVVPVVTEHDISEVISAWTGIPVDSLSEEETEKIINLEDAIKMRVIGQDTAVKLASRAVSRAASIIHRDQWRLCSFVVQLALEKQSLQRLSVLSILLEVIWMLPQ